MRCPSDHPGARPRRAAKTLTLLAILLPALLGMAGLVIDGGLLMSSQRQAQNAADAAALAAALNLFRGDPKKPTAETTAKTFVTLHNGLSAATVNVHFDDEISGPYRGHPNFVEVIVSYPVDTWLIRVLGIQRSTVWARAVAGFEPVASGEGAIVLDPYARPGLAVSGGATLKVDGSVVVNSQGAGNDQYGAWVDWGTQQYALTTSNNSKVMAGYIQVRGGVDVVSNYQNIDPAGDNPLFCRGPISPDPLRDLPVPTAANVPSISDWTRKPPITVNSGETKVLDPGVYEDINILQGTTLTLNPGVYILSPTQPNQGFRTNGSCTLTGDGVMFYATGSNYLDTSPGYWDQRDGALDGPLPPTNGPAALPPAPDPDFNRVRWATVNINATNSRVTLKGLQNAQSPFNDILFFQRRRNTSAVNIQGNAGDNVTLGGTMYAKWANFKLAGGGRYDAQFIVGSMSVSGQAVMTINSTGKNFGRANQVFLVE